MAIRPNNLGQQGKVKWGVLGKRKTYTNEAFKVIETEKKLEQYDWEKKLKPWSAMDKGRLTVMMPGQVVTPPPPEGELWNESTQVWNTTTDNWENI